MSDAGDQGSGGGEERVHCCLFGMFDTVEMDPRVIIASASPGDACFGNLTFGDLCQREAPIAQEPELGGMRHVRGGKHAWCTIEQNGLALGACLPQTFARGSDRR